MPNSSADVITRYRHQDRFKINEHIRPLQDLESGGILKANSHAGITLRSAIGQLQRVARTKRAQSVRQSRDKSTFVQEARQIDEALRLLRWISKYAPAAAGSVICLSPLILMINERTSTTSGVGEMEADPEHDFSSGNCRLRSCPAPERLTITG
jgi:hypothetical protein